MARTPNDNSVRQQVFSTLDGLMDKPRGAVVRALQTKFDIGESYAKTLYQSHRRSKIKEGVLVTTYAVRDTKDGKPVTPHLVTQYKATAESGEYTTPKSAVSAYSKDLNSRLNAASKLVK